MDNRKSRLSIIPGFLLVAAAAAMWGTDGVLRVPLISDIPSGMLVFLEHVILVLVTIPFLRGVLPTLRRLKGGDWVSLVFIGAGASAVATALFTESFTHGEFTTTLLLQKLQPVVVLVAAWWILGERPLRKYWIFFVPAIGGAWLITFSNPFDVSITEATPALLAIGAAVLWGMGTVLGRRLVPEIEFKQLTAMRFLIGLPAAAVVVTIQRDWPILWSPSGGWGVSAGDFFGTASTPSGITVPGGLILLAAVPGLIALLSYYRGLRTTPAISATLAELTFVLSAVTLNYIFLNTSPDGSQWAGVLVLAGAVVALGIMSASRRRDAMGVVVDQHPLVREPV